MSHSLRNYITLGFIACLLFSCKSTNSPKAVTETFLVSVARLDINAARNYSTRPTWDFLKVLDKSTKDLTPEQKESFLNGFKVKILGEKKLNDSTAMVRFSTTPVLLPFNELELKAEKNLEGNIKWKVNYTTLSYVEADTSIQEVMMPGVDSLEEQLELLNTPSAK
ncbi:hypothetical protein DBR32_09925 [Taibaiella sp. KBW10]|uniref:DUF4878 domain-containing protein n=1 Tax=Taibaiella sp. KBW10 TaxID=2153357 RepID=UPI000F59A094|nr:DUF4878 domain-containing protein [Taibaiella sp. KBW10]RQO31016.1 hypothetical protein DBR32_09925 [Taibaiella sp. KBW10]